MSQGFVRKTSLHTLLDDTLHTDVAAQTVTRGSLIYGNSTPKWDELVVGSAGAFLRNDATDVMWSTLILPNAATANRLVYATASNTYGESADLTYDGTDLAIASGKRFRMQSQNRFRYLNSIVVAAETANQTITTSTTTAVTFNDTDLVDTDSLHDTVTNNSRLTAAIAGKYYFFGYTNFSANATGFRFVLVSKNGGGTYLGQLQLPSGSTNTHIIVNGIIELVAGDYIELSVFQDSGGDLTLTNGFESKFGMAYIGE